MRRGIPFLILIIVLFTTPAWAESADAEQGDDITPVPEENQTLIETTASADGDQAPLDIMLVLDNSGSMKRNDPHFLTKEVVTDFSANIPADSRVGIVIFDRKAELSMPLTSSDEDGFAETVNASLRMVNYGGKYTNSPAGVERALYELKQNGREKAEKAIIFLTDGIVDTGDADRDREQSDWLRQDLTADASENNIRVFGIAFTDQADFQLIQALAQKTEGEYFRAFQAEEIQGIFEKIKQNLREAGKKISSTPVPQAEQAVSVPSTTAIPPETEDNLLNIIIIVVLLISMAVVIAIVVVRTKRGKGPIPPDSEGQGSESPIAYLYDHHDIMPKSCYNITKKVTRIGRVEGEDPGNPLNDIVIPQETVSAQHAQIEYRNNRFYIIDLESANGTFVDGNRVDPKEEKLLKHGYTISLDKYELQFCIPGAEEGGKTVEVKVRDKQSKIEEADQPKPTVPDQSPPEPEGKEEPSDDSGRAQAGKPDYAEREEEDKDGTKQMTGRCYYHKHKPAVACCAKCGRELCQICAIEDDGQVICRRCAK